MRALAVIVLLGLVPAGPAAAGNAALVRSVDARLHGVRVAQADARSGEWHAVQRQYDEGRDLAEAVRGAGRVGAGCGAFAAAADALAAAEIRQAEGVDGISPAEVRAGAREAAGAWAAIGHARPACLHAGDPAPATVRTVALTAPQSLAVVPGRLVVSARAPAGAAWATVAVGPRRLDCRRRVALAGRRLTVAVTVAPGRHDVRVGFCAARGLVAVADASGVWLLPASAARRIVLPRNDPGAAARLAAVARTFPGFSGVFFRDLATGRTAAANADARFPAASTVKLGVLVAALRRFGPRAEESTVGYDLEAMVERSSNLAANRLLVQIGGSEWAGAAAADRALKDLGAASSTFTGPYRIGTSVGAEPPRVSGRVTTARDLGRVLAVVHAGAVRGNPASLRRLGVSWHEAQVALNLMLSSDLAVPANAGLFRPWLARSTPVAQKNGWIHDARHTAAIVYGSGGPRIVVLLTFRRNLGFAAAQDLGRRVLRALRF